MQLRIGFLVVLFVAGCTKVPFEKTLYVPLDHADPAAVVKQYENRLPDKYRLLNSVVIKYNGKKFAGLGFVDINATGRTYGLACLTPMGLKLFELSGNDEKVTGYFVPDQITKHKEFFANMIGEDIRRIYFDPVPSTDAVSGLDTYQVIFRQPQGAGTLVYLFAGAGGHLVRKSYYEEHKLMWKVSYYEYQEKESGLYPGGIILNNYKNGYSLTFRLKEVLN